ncbi:hypothetical protein DFH07DRAFT_742304 [Mycena maculata]|uniref:MYND-type domain-containing protein n=1 Tax=Mycena maculata TaxID=230809 RepID=A0AAD7J7J0_9AGAR|nr:hypothetical protein DFH07DRAFT_742304 [Mycena maculata]
MSLDLLLFLAIVLTILLKNWKSTTPTPSSTKSPCIRCGMLTSLRCSSCHEAYYCSPEHITADWKNHKVVCRPGFEALLFPVDAAAPVLVKIPYTSKVDTDGLEPTPYHDLDSATLRRFLHGLEMKYVSRIGSHGHLLERPLVVMYGSDFRVDNSPLNQCIAGITGGRMGIPWAGNVLVLRQKGRLYYETYESASMEDASAMAKFFEEYQDFVPYEFSD